MRIAIITPLFNGITPMILGQSVHPVGMPPVYKFQKRISEISEEVLVIHGLDNPSKLLPENRKDWSKFDRLKKGNIQYNQVFIDYKGVFKWLFENKPDSRLLGLYRIYKFYNKMYDLIKKFKPDFLYVTTMYGFIGGLISWRLKVPTILRGYGTLLGTEMNPGDVYSLKYILQNIIEMYPYRMFPHILMTDDGTNGDKIADAMRVEKSRFHFWINGVDDLSSNCLTDVEKLKKTYKFPTNKKIIAAVSRIDDWKRVDRIIKAFPKIHNEFPETILVIGGTGQLLKQMSDLIRDLGIEKHVYLLGAIPHHDATALIKGCDIFVSLYDVSNLCNPVLEALTLGKCVVSINDGSLKSIITNGGNGILLEKDNISKTLSIEIGNLLRDDKKRLLIGENAKKTGIKIFDSWDNRINKEIELINIVMKNHLHAKLWI